VAKSLERAGHKVARIHADRSQGQRRSALEGFREGTYRVLVATDIAARGIDIAEIGHVVNFDLPHVPEDYVHRIGRTARMAASGRASSFASPEEADLLRGIERLTRKVLPRGAVPRDSTVFRNELARADAARGSAAPRSPRPGPRRQGTQGRAGERCGARGAGGGAGASGSGAASGSPPPRPKLLGSWGPKGRRGRR
jgi:ATP-dependent RNA helicase RhlE